MNKIKNLFKKKSNNKKKRPNKKDKKILSPKSYKQKFPPQKPKSKTPEPDIEVIDIPLDPEPEEEYVEKYIRIGKQMRVVRVKLHRN